MDLADRHQTIDGFGASYRVWDDPHLIEGGAVPAPEEQAEIVAALVDDLGLTRLRAIHEPGLEPENDNDDPFVLDMSRLVFDGRRADEPARVAMQFLDAGLPTVFPAPIRLEPWMESPEEFAEWGLALLLRWRDQGVEPALYSPLNEPAHDRAGRRSPEWFAAAVAALGRGIRSAGLTTKLVLPDDLNPPEALARARAVLEDEEARPFVGALAFHLYGGAQSDRALDEMEALGERYGLPLWMTEFTDGRWGRWPDVLGWAGTIHGMLTEHDVSAVDSMWAFFGSQDRSSALIAIGEGGLEATPMFFVTRQWSRYVRPGFVRVGVESDVRGILASAFVSPNDNEVVLVLVNRDGGPQRFDIGVSGAQASTDVRPEWTSVTARGTSDGTASWDGSTIGVGLPAASVTTLRFTVDE